MMYRCCSQTPPVLQRRSRLSSELRKSIPLRSRPARPSRASHSPASRRADAIDLPVKTVYDGVPLGDSSLGCFCSFQFVNSRHWESERAQLCNPFQVPGLHLCTRSTSKKDLLLRKRSKCPELSLAPLIELETKA